MNISAAELCPWQCGEFFGTASCRKIKLAENITEYFNECTISCDCKFGYILQIYSFSGVLSTFPCAVVWGKFGLMNSVFQKSWLLPYPYRFAISPNSNFH